MPPFSSAASYPSLGCALRLKWQVDVISVCVHALVCLLYVIMCARSVGEAWLLTRLLIVLACLPLLIHLSFPAVRHQTHDFPSFFSPFLSSSSLKSPSRALTTSVFAPLSVSWVLISVVHVSLLYQSSQGICIPNEQSTSLTCKLMDVNYAFMAAAAQTNAMKHHKGEEDNG